MATATILEDFTQAHACDAITGITAIGTTKASQETDNYMEGSASVGFEQKTTANERKGGYCTVTSTNLSNTYLAIWIFITAQQSIATLASGGVRVYVGDGTNWGEWYVGGSDTPWTGSGWKRVVVHTSTAFDNNSGSDPSLSGITQIGAVWYPTALLGKLPGMYMDDIEIGGTYYEVTGGSSSDPITLADIIAADSAGFGAVVQGRAGSYEINVPLTIGDQSGSSNTYFQTTGEIVAFADQRLNGNAGIYLAEDTGTTGFQTGETAGSGDGKVGYSGSIFYLSGSTIGGAGAAYQVDLSTAVDTVKVYGSTFIEAQGAAAVKFSTDTSHEVFSSSFVDCGQVDLGAVIARRLTFSGYTPDGDAALLWNSSINIRSSQFLGNTDATNDPHAIEHPAAGTFAYYGLTFAGNDYDVNFSAASGTLTINCYSQAGVVSNPSSYEITSGGSSVSFITAVSVKVTAQDAATYADVVGARVLVAAATGGDLPFEDSVGLTFSAGTVTVSHTGHGLATGDKVLIAGATANDYNGVHQITVTGTNAYTYTISGTPSSPDSGTSTAVILDGATDSNGEIEDSAFNYTSDQPIFGRVRKGTSTPLYRTSEFTGTILSSGFDGTVLLVKDE
jgi:hypothetical protein